MDTDGGSYFFTRIKKLPAAGGPSGRGLHFKKRVLRSMDAIIYDQGVFGRVRDECVSNHRGSKLEKWKRFARRSGNDPGCPSA